MEPCKQEETIKDLVEAKGFTEAKLGSIETVLVDIKDNHLKTIYKELRCIVKKLSGRSNKVLYIIITILTTVVGVLLREVLR